MSPRPPHLRLFLLCRWLPLFPLCLSTLASSWDRQRWLPLSATQWPRARLLLPLGQAAYNWPGRLGASGPSGPSASWLLGLQCDFLFAGWFLELSSQFELTHSAPPPSLNRDFLSSVGSFCCLRFCVRGALGYSGHLNTSLRRAGLDSDGSAFAL